MTERYRDFHLQLLAGEWREGCGEESRPVQNPYSGETLTTIRSATSADLDAAYQKAAEAQIAWADTPPAERSALMLGVLSIFDERKDEIIDWLIYESGSTRLKANIEWGSARAITQEAASMPARAHGATMASNIPGKDNLVFSPATGCSGCNQPLELPAAFVAAFRGTGVGFG